MSSARDELVQQAHDALLALGFDKTRSNERSALTLLSLLGLRPGDSWADATRGLCGVTPLMNWMAAWPAPVFRSTTCESWCVGGPPRSRGHGLTGGVYVV